MLNRILSILVIAVCFSSTAQKKQVVLSVTPKDAEVGENVVITVETNIKGEIALDIFLVHSITEPVLEVRCINEWITPPER